jgi:hypothetical protein
LFEVVNGSNYQLEIRKTIDCGQSNRLIKSAQEFQGKMVKKWNSDIYEPILSIILCLLSTNTSASKECGVITLDRLLQAVVFVEQEGGS